MISFQGFKPSGMEKIANAMGFQGNIKDFQKFLQDNPDRQAEMLRYQDIARKMVEGGYVKMQEGGTTDKDKDNPTNVSPTAPIADITAERLSAPALPEGAVVKPTLTRDEAGTYIPPTTGQLTGERKAGTFFAETEKADDIGTAAYKAVNFKVNYSNAHDRMTNANGLPGLQQDKITKYYIELPIPQEVNDSNSVTWGEDSLNIFQLAGLAAAQNLIKEPGRSFQAVAEVLQKGIPLPELDENTKNAVLAGISGQAINALGGNVSPGSVIARSTGQILNSNLELLFQGVNLRSFPFSVTFSPRNDDETERVRLIIRYLKQTMAPKIGNEGGRMGTFLKSPDVFSLRYLHNGQDHPFLNSFKLCALTGLSVNYTNAGTYASYSDGTPVNIRLNMSFKELNPIYSEDYDGGDAGGGVGY